MLELDSEEIPAEDISEQIYAWGSVFLCYYN